MVFFKVETPYFGVLSRIPLKLVKEFTKDFTEDFIKDFTKDFTKNFTKDFTKDSTKDFTGDFSKDFTTVMIVQIRQTLQHSTTEISDTLTGVMTVY